MSLRYGQSIPAPLPWPWVDFDRPPASASALPQTLPTIEEGGWQHSWQIHEDGRSVPFKLFRHAASTGTAKRPILLLAHGMGLTIATFRGIAPYLLQTHDLVLPDYSSFTPAGDPGTHPLGMKTFMRSIWRIADALSLERLSLGGNSLGGGLCLLAAIMQPQARASHGVVEPRLLSAKTPGNVSPGADSIDRRIVDGNHARRTTGRRAGVHRLCG